jgi:hypothetical protein
VPQPILKQFVALSPEDFERHPVWIACHAADYDEPWYDETDEETFRPYSGPLPADASDLLLVSATATMSDGSRHPGLLSPSQETGDMAALQPHVFVGGRAYGFWRGMVGVPEAERRAFHDATGKVPEDAFPIRFTADPSLLAGVMEAEVPGWLPTVEPQQPRTSGHRRWFKRGGR